MTERPRRPARPAPGGPAPVVATMSVPQGDLLLERYPTRHRETLRAWDAADELLLARLAGLDVGVDPGWTPVEATGPTVVLNDAFGALGVALSPLGPTVVSDSYGSRVALARNLERNGRTDDAVTVVSPLDPLPAGIGLLLVRPTRSLALLEHQLRAVAPLLGPEAVVIGAEMTKHLHSSTLEVFERIIGPTTTTRAHRRARLVHSVPETGRDPGPWNWPVTFGVEPGQHRITSLPGVFSAQRLDQGTALLLQHLPETDGPEQIVDLGCGNGVVGMIAAAENPEAELTFVDDSALAVESARLTFTNRYGSGRAARFVNGNGLGDWPGGTSIDPGSVDLVLNNPPFHDNHALGDAIAWQMFTDAHRALRPGGELWCVGNRHLAYHAKLKRIFGNCDVVASSSKFVLLRAVRR